MRYRPTGEEKEKGAEEKAVREKQSQVLLAQRVQHIKRLRQARREDVVANAEWYKPKQPNRDWRNAFEPAPATAEPAADRVGAGAGPGGPAAAVVVDEISEMIEFKAERCVGGWF